MIHSPNEEAPVSNQASFASPVLRSRARKRRSRKRRWSGGGATETPVSVRSSPTPQQISRRKKRRRWSPNVLRLEEISVASSPSPAKLRLSPKSIRKSRRRSLQPYRAGRCPYFNASEIAAITGLHKHGVPLHALVRCWRRYDRESLCKWERITGGVKLPEMTFAQHANSHVRDAVQSAVAEGDGVLRPTSEASIVKAIQENAPRTVWKTLTEEALGRARCGRGTRLEHKGLAAYEQAYGREVVRRNQDSFRQQFGAGCSAFVVSGRVDGFEMLNGERCVVEHKRRQRRLFEEVPQYEEVQCQVYMVLTGTISCRWVQTLGSDIDVRSLARCNSRWSCIRGRLKATAVLLRRLCSGSACPAVPELEAMQRDCWAAAPSWPSGSAPSPDGKALQEINSVSTSTDDCLQEAPQALKASRVDCTVVCNDSSSVLAMDVDISKSTCVRGEESRKADLFRPDLEPTPCVYQAHTCVTAAEEIAPLLASASLQADIPPTMPDEENGTILDESPMLCPEIGSQWEPAPTEVDGSESEHSPDEPCLA